MSAPAPVQLRVAVAADDEFLRQLCLEARPELQLLPPELVDLQLTAQRAQYRRDHPDALDEIVEVGGDPVGRCWTDDTDGDVRLLDVAVRTERRRRGIGRAVLDLVAARAAARGVGVRLAVWSANTDARRLYAAAGYRETAELGGHVLMRLENGSSA